MIRLLWKLHTKDQPIPAMLFIEDAIFAILDIQ